MASRIDRGIRLISRLLAIVAGIAILVMLVLATADVLTRYIRGRGITGVVEYSEILLVLLTLLSLAHAQRHDAHVAVDFLSQRLPTRIAALIQAIALAVIIGAIVVLIRRSTEIAMESWSGGEHTLGIARVPLWPARFAVPIGFAAFLLELLATAIRQAGIALTSPPGHDDDATADGHEADGPVASGVGKLI